MVHSIDILYAVYQSNADVCRLRLIVAVQGLRFFTGGAKIEDAGRLRTVLLGAGLGCGLIDCAAET